MNRLRSTAVVAASLLGSVLYAAPARETISPVSTVLTVDGVACGPVTKWDGGDMRAEVIHEDGTGLLKHGGRAQCSPVSFEVPFPAPKPLMDLITGLCANKPTRANLVLADVSSGSLGQVHALEIQNAFLTEVRIPALRPKDFLRVILVFQGEYSRTAAPTAPSSSGSRRNAIPVSVRFEVPGVDLSGVTHVEAFTIKQKVKFDDLSDSSGAPTTHAARAELPNSILVTLHRENSDGLAAWRDTTFSSSPGSNEKNGTLSLFDGDARPIVTFQFTNLGILRLSVVPNAAPAPRMMQAEFYCEGITITEPEVKTEARPRISS